MHVMQADALLEKLGAYVASLNATIAGGGSSHRIIGFDKTAAGAIGAKLDDGSIFGVAPGVVAVWPANPALPPKQLDTATLTSSFVDITFTPKRWSVTRMPTTATVQMSKELMDLASALSGGVDERLLAGFPEFIVTTKDAVERRVRLKTVAFANFAVEARLQSGEVIKLPASVLETKGQTLPITSIRVDTPGTAPAKNAPPAQQTPAQIAPPTPPSPRAPPSPMAAAMSQLPMPVILEKVNAFVASMGATIAVEGPPRRVVGVDIAASERGVEFHGLKLGDGSLFHAAVGSLQITPPGPKPTPRAVPSATMSHPMFEVVMKPTEWKVTRMPTTATVRVSPELLELAKAASGGVDPRLLEMAPPLSIATKDGSSTMERLTGLQLNNGIVTLRFASGSSIVTQVPVAIVTKDGSRKEVLSIQPVLSGAPAAPVSPKTVAPTVVPTPAPIAPKLVAPAPAAKPAAAPAPRAELRFDSVPTPQEAVVQLSNFLRNAGVTVELDAQKAQPVLGLGANALGAVGLQIQNGVLGVTPAGVELWPPGAKTPTPVGIARIAMGDLFAARFSKGKMEIERAPSVSLHAALDIFEMLKTVQFDTTKSEFTNTVLRALPSFKISMSDGSTRSTRAKTVKVQNATLVVATEDGAVVTVTVGGAVYEKGNAKSNITRIALDTPPDPVSQRDAAATVVARLNENLAKLNVKAHVVYDGDAEEGDSDARVIHTLHADDSGFAMRFHDGSDILSHRRRLRHRGRHGKHRHVRRARIMVPKMNADILSVIMGAFTDDIVLEKHDADIFEHAPTVRVVMASGASATGVPSALAATAAGMRLALEGAGALELASDGVTFTPLGGGERQAVIGIECVSEQSEVAGDWEAANGALASVDVNLEHLMHALRQPDMQWAF